MASHDQNRAAEFFVAGGTLRPSAPSYVERKADSELFEAIRAGEFCYVLTSRQMGKSSLFSRAADRLRREAYHVSIVDLQSIGINVTVDQWFDGMLERVGSDFDLEDEIDDFRNRNTHLGALQLWLEAIRRVVLEKITGRVVIVIDEIDLVRSIRGFRTDDLFLGIRELYNRRGLDPALERLNFCLLGVASPGDLIQNKDVTPFNIGHRIELKDFTETEVLGLAHGISHVSPDAAIALIKRAYYWTGGQPYLTQRLCQAVAQNPSIRVAKDLDDLVANLFLNQRSTETEPHFIFIRDRLLTQRGDDRGAVRRLLELYLRVLRGRYVRESEVDDEVTHLKLSGLVRGEEGFLAVKNPIYRRNFSPSWVRSQLPYQLDWKTVVNRASTVVKYALPVLFILLALYIYFVKSDFARTMSHIHDQFLHLYKAKIAQALKSDSRRVMAGFYLHEALGQKDSAEQISVSELTSGTSSATPVDASRLQPAGTFRLAPVDNQANDDSGTANKKTYHCEILPYHFPSAKGDTGLLFVTKSSNDDAELAVSYWNSQNNPTPVQSIDCPGVTALAICPQSSLVAAAFTSGNSFEHSPVNLKIAVVKSLNDLNTFLGNLTGAQRIDLPKKGQSVGGADSSVALVTRLSFSPDGKSLAMGFDSGEVALVDLTPDAKVPAPLWDPKKNLHRDWWKGLETDKRPVSDLTFVSFEGLLRNVLFAGTTDKIYFCASDSNLSNSFPYGSILPYPDAHAVAFSGGPNKQIVFNAATSKSDHLLRVGQAADCLALSADGNLFVAGLGDGSVSLGAGMDIMETAPGFVHPVDAVSFSPDGNFVIAVDNTGLARLWRVLGSPASIIHDGESLDAALGRWGLAPDDTAMDFKVSEELDDSWKTVQFVPAAAEDYSHYWEFQSNLEGTMADLNASPDEADITHRLEAALQLGHDLEKEALPPADDINYKKLQQYLSAKTAPPFNDFQQLPVSLQWVLLVLRLDGWLGSLSHHDAGQYLLQYANCIGSRRQMSFAYPFAKQNLINNPAANSQILKAVEYLKKAFDLGVRDESAYGNLPSAITSSPLYQDFARQLSDWKSKRDQLLTDLQNVGPSDDPAPVLARFEQYKKDGGTLDLDMHMAAAKAYGVARNFVQADMECHDAVASISDSDADRFKEKANVLFIQAGLCMQRNAKSDPEMALDHIREATLKLNPDSVDLWKQRATFEQSNGGASYLEFIDLPGMEEAAIADRQAALRQIDSKSPCVEWLRLQLGILHSIMGDVEDGEDQFAQALKANPSRQGMLDCWGNSYAYTEQEHQWLFDRLNQAIPADWVSALHALHDDQESSALFELVMQRIFFYRDTDQNQKVRSETLQVLSHPPSEPMRLRALAVYANLLRDLGLYDLSQHYFDTLVTTRNIPDTHDAYGDLLVAMGQFDRAVDQYRLAQSESQGDVPRGYRIDLGVALAKGGRLKDALAEFQKLNGPGGSVDPEAQAYIAIVLRREAAQAQPADAAKLESGAVAAMTQANTLWNSGLSTSFSWQLDAALFLGDTADAQKTLAALLKIWPTETSGRVLEEIRTEMADSSNPGGTDRALGKMGRLIQSGFYNFDELSARLIDGSVKALPHYAELVAAAKVSGVADMPARELRLADWLDKLQVADPEAISEIKAAATTCRGRAQQYKDHPMELPPLNAPSP